MGGGERILPQINELFDSLNFEPDDCEAESDQDDILEDALEEFGEVVNGPKDCVEEMSDDEGDTNEALEAHVHGVGSGLPTGSPLG